MSAPRSEEEFAERFLIPLTNDDDSVTEVDPGMFGGWCVTFDDGWTWGIQIKLVERGDD